MAVADKDTLPGKIGTEGRDITGKGEEEKISIGRVHLQREIMKGLDQPFTFRLDPDP